jgi:polyvinyl alcohol dehydrogenase (cytochrome)
MIHLHSAFLRNCPKSLARSARLLRALAPALAAFALALIPTLEARAQVEWPQFGQNNSNTASNQLETAISPTTAVNLKEKWKFTTKGDVSARPAVVNGVVYFPDWGGYLWAVNAITGKAIWGKNVTSYVTDPATGKPYMGSVFARATPAVHNGMLFIGLHGAGGYFLGINANNGNLVWKTRLDTADPYAAITGGSSVNGSVVYVGVTSEQESVGGNRPKTAQGSVVALNASNGKILWKTCMVPSGYTGATVWGGSPVVDPNRAMVYVATGDNYSTPTDPAYVKCVKGGKSANACQSASNHADSVVALSMTTGSVKWAGRLEEWPEDGSSSGSDYFNSLCSQNEPGCPTPEGPDFDFGSAPNEITYLGEDGSVTIIGAGQKSGIYYALNPENGDLLWQRQVGPGSRGGGIMWGSATDGQRIYVAIANRDGVGYAGGNAGSWAALNPANGEILWQVPDPYGAMDVGPVAVANGVVYVPSTAGQASDKNMIALNAATGKTLWNFASETTTIGGAAIVNGVVYWGTGYSHLPLKGFTGGANAFYAFSIDGN